MKKNYIVLLILLVGFSHTELFAQSLNQAKEMFKRKEYAKAKPAFKKFATSNPSNGSYNYWYGVCCYETGEQELSEKYLLIGAKKKVQESFRYLGQLYFEQYRFQESEEYYEEYIAILKKAKKSTETFENRLEQAKMGVRMIKGVEIVTIIDSFVVDKKNFLEAYKIGEDAGSLMSYRQYFDTKMVNPGTVYEPEMRNKLFYGDRNKENKMDIFTRSRQTDDWGKPTALPAPINTSANENYPYVLTDGVTIYYASDGEGTLGGYDIFVTRYNTNTDSYLTPDNVGMPFNSPYNDYMFVIDEFNNLGWFASDRYQPENKVCVYVFIPNSSKLTYNYESTDIDSLRSVARIHSIEETWSNMDEVRVAKQRLSAVKYHRPKEEDRHDFVFIIDDTATYYTLESFSSPIAKSKFQRWQKKQINFSQLSAKLEELRTIYSNAQPDERQRMTSGILDMEKRMEQMEMELKQEEIEIRNEEIKKLMR